MRTALLAFIVLFPAVCSAQGTPAGVYRAPGNLEDWSYEPHHKERFTVSLYAPVKETNEEGQEVEVRRCISQYFITDSQWPGMRRNVEKWCRQYKMRVAKIDGGSSVNIYLVKVTPPGEKPPKIDEEYVKGGLSAPPKK